MPTPSSHDGNDAHSFNSTCPEDQMPHAPSGWLRPPPPYEDEQSPRTAAAGSSSNPGDTGESQQSPADDDEVPGSAHSSPALSPRAEQPGTDDRSATIPMTEPLFSHESEHEPEPQEDDGSPNDEHDDDDDDENKNTDTDEDMPDNTHPEEEEVISDERSIVAAESRNRASGSRSSSSRRPAGSRETARFEIPETDQWEPYGVNQALGRRFDIASLGPSPSRRTVPAGIYSAAAAAADATLQRLNIESNAEEGSAGNIAWLADPSTYMGCDPTSVRLIQTAPSTFLRPGSRFIGTQQSERQVYDVQVEIKHVDLRESFLCGYLRIQGLTEDHPTLTTYFEGEIIGSKYGFTTKHKSWGANDRIDMSHWAKFAAFRQFAKQAKKGNFVIKEYLQKENIFMRWKEHFLVPDHRVKTIHGASFEGFYYICFNQVEGVVHGIYFHSKSEKFQQLELKHVEDKGCMSALEFR